MRAVRDDLDQVLAGGQAAVARADAVVVGVEDPGRLADLVASNVTMKVSTGQALLEEMDPIERLRKVGAILQKEVEILEVQATIQSRAKEEMSKAQREYFLREQLRQIQSELGGGAAKGDLDALRAQIESARMPTEARAEAERQLRRLEQANPDSAEAGVLRTYLEWLVEVPWVIATDDKLDLAERAQILDEDHYGLEDVKDRILEHLGVLKLTRERGRVEKGPILCFVGPPGVGKTSLGRSIARALGRKFVRMSLGGVRDEAEIRGHRRTYVGAHAGARDPGAEAGGHDQPGASCSTRSTSSAPIFAAIRRRRCSRCSIPSRTHLPRSLPRRRLRSVEGAVHRHGQRGRSDSEGARRSHGDHPAGRLLRGGEARDHAAPRAAAAARAAPGSTRSRLSRDAACASSSPTTRARRGCAISSGRSRASRARWRGSEVEDRRGEAKSVTMPALSARSVITPRGGEVPRAAARRTSKSSCTGRRGRRGDGAGLDAVRRRGARGRGAVDAGQGLADPDRPARRRHEGVGDDRAVVSRARAPPRSGSRKGSTPSARSTSTCRRARCPRTDRRRA